MGISDITDEDLLLPSDLPHGPALLFHTHLHFQRLPFHAILPHALQKPFGLPDFHSSSVRAATRACSPAREFLAKRPRCMAHAVRCRAVEAGRLALAHRPRMARTGGQLTRFCG